MTVIPLNSKEGSDWLASALSSHILPPFDCSLPTLLQNRSFKTKSDDLDRLKAIANKFDLTLDSAVRGLDPYPNNRSSMNSVFKLALFYDRSGDSLHIQHECCITKSLRPSSGASIPAPPNNGMVSPTEKKTSLSPSHQKHGGHGVLPELSALLARRTIGERFFPSQAVERHFSESLKRFVVKDSGVIKKGVLGLGLFLGDMEDVIEPSDVPIGVYSGTLSSGTGVYHLELTDKAGTRVIDGSPLKEHPMTCFGRMNEDIYDEVFNVRILDNGSIIAIRTIKPGDELLTKYGNDSKSTKERGYD